MWNPLNIFKKNKEVKRSRINEVLYASSAGAQWTKKDYKKYAEESYLKNIIAFRCIVEIAKNTASVPFGLFSVNKKGERGEQLEDDPITDVLIRPNSDEGFPFFLAKATAFLIMAGNSYIERVTPKTGPNRFIPKELFVQRPDRMRIEPSPDKKRIWRYIYEVNGQETYWYVNPISLQSDILHLKEIHPTDDWYGAAITESVAREIDTSNEQTEWNKKLLENEGRPGLVVTIVGNLSDDQYEKMEKALASKHSGTANVGKSLILEGEKGTTAQPYGWSPTDMDFIEGGRELARRIALGYGVPPQLLGIPGDSTYSNYETARLAFYEDTIFWYLNYFKSEMNNWLFKNRDRKMIDYIIDDIPALAPRRERMWKRAQESQFLTINEKRALVRKDPVPNGDIILVSNNMISLDNLKEFIKNKDQTKIQE